ncbi:MAG: hypothetical protein IKF90_22955, partial [Parasporobacterium sp.]|nr:hypothetical protein [Parasporobacterium sp.]
KIEGKNFGKDVGEVYFGDTKIDPPSPSFGGDVGPARQEILTWNDTEITVRLVGVKVNGRVNVAVISSNGKKTQRSFIFNVDSGRKVFETGIKMPEEIKNCKVYSMIALNGKVYLVPETVNPDYNIPQVYDQLWSYDLTSGTWTRHKNIPEPEVVHSEDRGTIVELSTFGKYVVAHLTYTLYKKGIEPPEGSPAHTDKIYLYNPDKDTWTEADFSKLDFPRLCKAFGTDAGLFLTGGYYIVKETGDPEEGTSDYYSMVYNKKIFALEFDTAPVEAGAETVTVTGMREAGIVSEDPNVGVNQYATIQTFGDSTIILANSTIWLKWSESDKKFVTEGHADLHTFEDYGREHGAVQFVNSLLCGTNTPFGAVFAGVPGNNYTGRGFDTFFMGKDGSVKAFDRYVSFADLYDSKACYTNGFLIVWGDTFYKQDGTFGYMACTPLVKEVTPEIKLSQSSYTYDGKVKTPDVIVKADGQILKNGRDYDVKYADGRRNAGTYKVNVTLKGSYSGSASASFTIKKAALGSAKLSYTEKAYTGKALTPAVNVTAKIGGKTVTLKKDKDYQVTYKNNINVGKATVTVKGIGNFSGTITKTFKITKAANSISNFSPAEKTLKVKTLKQKAQTVQVTAKDKFGAKMKFELNKDKSSAKVKRYITVSTAGKVTVKKGTPAGVYAVRINVSTAATSNYTAKTVTRTLKITVK